MVDVMKLKAYIDGTPGSPYVWFSNVSEQMDLNDAFTELGYCWGSGNSFQQEQNWIAEHDPYMSYHIYSDDKCVRYARCTQKGICVDELFPDNMKIEESEFWEVMGS